MKTNRIAQMEAFILKNTNVSIDALCEMFGVSKNTVRRDIDELCASGLVKKVYGGVTAIAKAGPTSFEQRTIQNMEQKQRIARCAAKLVEADDSIYIDSGTTTFSIVPHLASLPNVNVFTNNIQAVFAAYPIESIRLYSLPGSLQRKISSVIGPDTLKAIEKFNITKAFMAATGVSLSSGVTNSAQTEYEVKKLVVEKSSQVYLLVDSGKFGKISLMTYCQIEDVTAIITDAVPPQEYVDYLQEHHVGLIIAE